MIFIDRVYAFFDKKHTLGEVQEARNNPLSLNNAQTGTKHIPSYLLMNQVILRLAYFVESLL